MLDKHRDDPEAAQALYWLQTASSQNAFSTLLVLEETDEPNGPEVEGERAGQGEGGRDKERGRGRARLEVTPRSVQSLLSEAEAQDRKKGGVEESEEAAAPSAGESRQSSGESAVGTELRLATREVDTTNGELKGAHMITVAIKPINEGEEIFVSYGVNYWASRTLPKN